jgi:hypothetical protein
MRYFLETGRGVLKPITKKSGTKPVMVFSIRKLTNSKAKLLASTARHYVLDYSHNRLSQ